MLLGLHIKTRQELGDLSRALVAILAQRGRSFPKDWFGCRSLASSALCARHALGSTRPCRPAFPMILVPDWANSGLGATVVR